MQNHVEYSVRVGGVLDMAFVVCGNVVQWQKCGVVFGVIKNLYNTHTHTHTHTNRAPLIRAQSM
ncbi:MAG: hypothetical protein RR329_04295 [Mucinivorans sp.]